MVNVSGSVDDAQLQANLSRLSGELALRLARSIAVAGGEVLRDEARARAPVGPTTSLREAIYLAFRDKLSTDQQVVYSVTWNKRKAPHGHLIEFGHWQTHATYMGSDGNWYTDPKRPLPKPKWIAAVPFLRPAYDAAYGPMQQSMRERGRQRLPELLAEGARDDA